MCRFVWQWKYLASCTNVSARMGNKDVTNLWWWSKFQNLTTNCCTRYMHACCSQLCYHNTTTGYIITYSRKARELREVFLAILLPYYIVATISERIGRLIPWPKYLTIARPFKKCPKMAEIIPSIKSFYGNRTYTGQYIVYTIWKLL